MTDVRVFRVEISVSEYNGNDEGFYNIKQTMETTKGKERLKETLDSIYFSTLKYLERRRLI
ncbi:hypothetical protein LCGC14_0860500 [marine sediment metagenome]|uniref:Uncharacterized protein n=1 Tax=marine sediment metagenome TaxID=412755 RepID=A0A0F9PCK1_9ZZZZ